jgi:hypothetical protein
MIQGLRLLAVLLCLELPVISMSLAAGSTAAGAPNPDSAQLVPSGPTPAMVLTSTEQWAMTEMERNQKVDFNARCRGQGVLDPRREDARWNDPCRRISGDATPLMSLADAEIAAAIGYAEQEKSSGTRRAYGSDWRAFVVFCDARGLEAMPATPGTAARFLSLQAEC